MVEIFFSGITPQAIFRGSAPSVKDLIAATYPSSGLRPPTISLPTADPAEGHHLRDSGLVRRHLYDMRLSWVDQYRDGGNG
jgi:hypothetical protein